MHLFKLFLLITLDQCFPIVLLWRPRHLLFYGLTTYYKKKKKSAIVVKLCSYFKNHFLEVLLLFNTSKI